jgi:hypothetical protein
MLMLELIYVKWNSIEKQVAKPLENGGFVTLENIPESRRKIVQSNEVR